MSGAETALEAAIFETLSEDMGVTALLGNPLRVIETSAPRPAYPYLEVVRHESEPAGSAGVEASAHRIDLRVVSRDPGGALAREAMAAVRAALADATLEMEDWHCVLLLPVYADTLQQRSGFWRSLLRLKAVVETEG